MRIFRLILVAAFLTLPLAMPRAAAAVDLPHVSASSWQLDLDYMVRSIEKYHVDPFHDVSRSLFDQRVAELRARLPHLNRAQAIVGLASIIALVRDAHTGFGIGTSPPISFHAFPIKVYQYSDGVFIQAAAPQYKQLVGQKIVAVGGVPISTVLQRLQTVVMSTNDWTFRSQLQFQFKGEILHALGLSQSDDAATLELRGPSGLNSVTLQTLPHPFAMGYRPGPPERSDWIDARTVSLPPLYLRHLDEYYWYEWLPDAGTLYVQCNFVLNSDKESFADFFSRVFGVADKEPVKKFVLDLRFNGGGDNLLLPVVVQNLVKRDSINAPGKLFVIIGRGTQSAAENLVNRLQRDTHATFVGEPTGERPNEFGDPWPFVLPNSHIEVHIASIKWEDIDPRDDRQWTGPDLAAELTSSDYVDGVDPAMDVIQKGSFIPIETALHPYLGKQTEALHQALLGYVGDPEHKFTQVQYPMEALATELIADKDFADAHSLLRWSAAISPNSARALDALCDSYLSTETPQAAKPCYASILARFPRDAIAASRISVLASGQLPDL
jgi:hypothetical protein